MKGLSLEVKIEKDKWKGTLDKNMQLKQEMRVLIDQVAERHRYIGALMEAISRISATPPGSPRKRA